MGCAKSARNCYKGKGLRVVIYSMLVAEYSEPTHDARVLVWAQDEDETFYRSALQLAEPETALLEAISHPIKRTEWLSARYAARMLVPNQPEVQILNDAHGRPEVFGIPGHLSLSHTHGLAAAGYSATAALGVDVERRGLQRNFEARRMFMNPTEMKLFAAHPTEATYLTIWTAKECLYKIFSHRERGLSFRLHFATLLTAPPPATGELSFLATVNSPAHTESLTLHCMLTATYVLCYACHRM